MIVYLKETIKKLFEKSGYKITSLERQDFLQNLPKHSIGAEIGVFKGEFSRHILEIVQPLKLYLMDGWLETNGEYFSWATDDNNLGPLKTKDAFEQAKKTVEIFDGKGVSEFVIGDDLLTLKKFENSYFDWVYLDSSHRYEPTKAELEILKDKVKMSGLITGHDWHTDSAHRHYGVYKAISEFCKKYNWKVIKVDRHGQWIIKRN